MPIEFKKHCCMCKQNITKGDEMPCKYYMEGIKLSGFICGNCRKETEQICNTCVSKDFFPICKHCTNFSMYVKRDLR